MTEPTVKSKSSPRKGRKVLIRLIIAAAVMLAILCGLLLLLPVMVSTRTVRDLAQTRISETLHTPVSIGRLTWRWSSGVLLENLRIADDSRFSERPMVTLDRLKLAVDPGGLRAGIVDVDLRVTGLTCRIIRNSAGKTNVERFLDRVPKQPEKPDPGRVKTPAPLFPALLKDIRARVQLADLTLVFEDRQQNRRIEWRNGRLSLDLPSLKEHPLTLTASSDIVLDGRNMAPLRLQAAIDNLINSRGMPDWHNLLIHMNGTLPGGHLSVKADLQAYRVDSSADLDLQQIFTVLRPFMPGTVLPDMTGKLACAIQVSTRTLKSGDFDIRVTGTGITVSGLPAGSAKTGPVDFQLVNAGTFDTEKGCVSIQNGEFRFAGENRVNWQGEVSGLDHGKPDIQLHLNCSSDLDLPSLVKLFKPMMPAAVARADISGRLRVEADLSGSPADPLAFDTRVTGRGLTYSGPATGNRKVGPLDVSLVHTGRFHAAGRSLLITSGTVDLQENSRMKWQGKVTGLRTDRLNADIRLGPVFLDLTECLKPVKALIPEPAQEWIFQNMASPSLRIEKVRVSGTLPTGTGHVRISGLTFQIPRLQTTAGATDLSAKHIAVQAEKIDSEIRGFFPESLDIQSSLRLRDLNVQGQPGLSVDRLAVPLLALKATDIRRDPRTLLGVTATLNIRKALTADGLAVNPLFSAGSLNYSLAAGIRLAADLPARVVLDAVNLSLSDMTVRIPGRDPFTTRSVIRAAASGITVRGVDPLRMDVNGLVADLEVGDDIQGHLKADASIADGFRLDTTGAVRVDLAGLEKTAAVLMSEISKLAGKVTVNWHVAGKLSGPDPMKKWVHMTTFDPVKDLAFLEDLAVSCRMENVGVDLGTANDRPVRIESMTTDSPLRYTYDGKRRKGTLSGTLTIDGIRGIPFIPFNQPMAVDLRITGKHDAVQSFSLSQTMVWRPFHIEQKLELALHGMDRIFSRDIRTPLPRWLEHVGGTLAATLRIPGSGKWPRLLDGLDVQGPLDTRLTLKLVPGKSIETRLRVLLPETQVQLADQLRLTNLRVDLDLSKQYRLRMEKMPAPSAKPSLKPVPLSTSVLQSAAATAVSPPQTRRRFAHIRPEVSFQSARVSSGPVPLDVRHFSTDLDLEDGLPRIDHFTVDVLGGTVAGALSVLKRKNGYFLQGRLAFTGLQTGKILNETPAAEGEDTEINGQLSVLLPLSTRMNLLIRDMHLDLNLSHIGRRAMERMLYALDPSESNETIVSQRRVLRMGSPRWVHMVIKDGSLSIGGEITVGGTVLKIPKLDRLNLANLQGLDRFESDLGFLKPMIQALEISSATIFRVDRKSGRIIVHSLDR